MTRKECLVILGISPNFSATELKSAYKKLAKRYHPDLHTSKTPEKQEECKKKFQEITKAYAILSGKDEDDWFGGQVDIPTYEDLLKEGVLGEYITDKDTYHYEVKGNTYEEIISEYRKSKI